jgi:hypothetical protein
VVNTSPARLTIALLSAALAACEQSDPGPVVEVTDSAGVPVYSLSVLPPWDAPEHHWKLTVERTISTAGQSLADEPMLYQPQAYARLNDGTLVVLDGGDFRLAVIDPVRDSVLHRFAPNGQGPGELWSSNATLWAAGNDSFWVLDPGNQRLSRFRLTGDLEEELAVTIPGTGGVVFQNPVDHLPWFWKIFYENPEDRIMTDSIGRLSLESARVDFIAPLPPRVESRRRPSSAKLLDPMSWFAPIGSGGVVAARSDQGRFRRYSDRGDLTALIHIPMSPAVIPEGEKVEILEGFYGAVRGTGPMDRDRVADRYPLFELMWGVEDSLFVLQQGYLSTPAGEPTIPEDQKVWRAFSPSGAYAGAIVLPPGVAQPYWIEPGRIIATQRDARGVATIVSFRLSPPGQGWP